MLDRIVLLEIAPLQAERAGDVEADRNFILEPLFPKVVGNHFAGNEPMLSYEQVGIGIVSEQPIQFESAFRSAPE